MREDTAPAKDKVPFRQWLTAVLLLAVFAFVGACIFGTPHYHTEEVDVRSGKLRIRTYRYWLLNDERIESTTLSIVAETAGFATTPPEWHMANLMRGNVLGLRSFHNFRFGAVPTEIRQLANIWEAEGFDQTARAASAKQFLLVLQKHPSKDDISAYLMSLSK